MTQDCFFKVGETYIRKDRKKFMVTSIKDNLITTNIKVNWFGDFLGYWDFEIESPMYDDLVVINKNPEAKKLCFVFPGGCWICCDSLMEEHGDYREYARIFGHEVKYEEEYKHLLTPEEIKRFEDFARKNKD